ncbi:MAG TPA: PilN domain-containing protein [Gemmatimonadales bacterium]|nr:PilN domain-containing protein [Gemmatimonadales bacterium]
MIEVNLLPGQKRKTAGGGSKIKLPDFKNLLASIKDPWLISAVVAWVLIGGGALALFFFDSAKKALLENRVTTEQHEADRYSTYIAEKRAQEKRRDSLVVQINVIRHIDGQRFVWPHLMDQITKALPPYTWLQDMQQTASAPVVPTSTGAGAAAAQRPSAEDSAAAVNTVNVTLNGHTVDIQAYTTFLRQLAASPWITDVTPATSQTVIEFDRPVTAFAVSFKYRQADSVFIRTVPLVQSVR